MLLAPPRNIILVGFMASGKSRVGRILARHTGWPLVDADEEIVRRCGKPVPQIFEEEGEEAFRTVERSVIADLCAGAGRIIAAGGGAFVDPDNRRRMLASGLVFCLDARAETIQRRVGKSATARPLLAGDNSLERIRALLAQRAGVYAQAHHTIETDRLTPEEVARSILGLCPGILVVE
jgi:shikimate kinase